MDGLGKDQLFLSRRSLVSGAFTLRFPESCKPDGCTVSLLPILLQSEQILLGGAVLASPDPSPMVPAFTAALFHLFRVQIGMSKHSETSLKVDCFRAVRVPILVDLLWNSFG